MVFGGRLVAALLLGIAAVVLRPHAGTVLLWLVIVANFAAAKAYILLKLLQRSQRAGIHAGVRT